MGVRRLVARVFAVDHEQRLARLEREYGLIVGMRGCHTMTPLQLGPAAFTASSTATVISGGRRRFRHTTTAVAAAVTTATSAHIDTAIPATAACHDGWRQGQPAPRMVSGVARFASTTALCERLRLGGLRFDETMEGVGGGREWRMWVGCGSVERVGLFWLNGDNPDLALALTKSNSI